MHDGRLGQRFAMSEDAGQSVVHPSAASSRPISDSIQHKQRNGFVRRGNMFPKQSSVMTRSSSIAIVRAERFARKHESHRVSCGFAVQPTQPKTNL